MLRYTINRILLMIPTLIGVAVLVFFMLRVVPGDIVEVKLRGDGGNVTQEVVDQERKRLGLDRPILIQFKDWALGLLRLDLGISMWTERPVIEEISLRLQLSLEVAILATLIAVLLAVPLGTTAALMRDTWVDYAVRIITIGGLSIPSFWFGMLIILTLLTFFNWLAADHVHADLRRSGRQSHPADLARDGGGLSLLRGDRAHDSLIPARGDDRGLHPYRAGKRPVRKARRVTPRASQCIACPRSLSSASSLRS